MQQLGVMKDRKANGSAIKARAHRGIRRLRKLTQTRSVGGRERERERERESARAILCVSVCVCVFVRAYKCGYMFLFESYTHTQTNPASFEALPLFSLHANTF